MLAVILLLTDRQVPAAADLGWGGLAGLCGMVGLVLFYRGPGGRHDERGGPRHGGDLGHRARRGRAGPSANGRAGWAALGIAVAVPAIVLLGWGGVWPPGADRHVDRRALALAAGGGCRVRAVLRDALTGGQAARDSWPVLAARCTSVASLVLLVSAPAGLDHGAARGLATQRWSGGSWTRPPMRSTCWRCDAGSCRRWRSSASLYPASTIVLASTVLHERLARLQWWGLALAGGGGGGHRRLRATLTPTRALAPERAPEHGERRGLGGR